MIDVHVVSRNVTSAACLLTGGGLKNTLCLKALKHGKASKSMPLTVRLTC